MLLPHNQFELFIGTILPVMNLYIPYGGKVWQVESLVNLANRLRFGKSSAIC